MIDLKAIEARYERMVALSEKKDPAVSAACAVSYGLDVPVLIAEVKALRRLLDDEREGAASQDEEISRLHARVEELRNEVYDNDRRIRDLEGELYDTQRQAERSRQESQRGW